MAGPLDPLGDHRRLVPRRPLFSRPTQPPIPPDHWIRVHRRILSCRFEVVLPSARTDQVTAAQKALDTIAALGAIGSGAALDRMATQLRRSGVKEALLSGGRTSILAIGGQQTPWLVALWSSVQGERLAQLRLKHGALGTHEVDLRGGVPPAGTLSASVVTARAAVAEALSKAFLIGGAELAREYCETHDSVLALITPDVSEAESRRPLVFGHYPGVRVE